LTLRASASARISRNSNASRLTRSPRRKPAEQLGFGEPRAPKINRQRKESSCASSANDLFLERPGV